MTWPEPTTSPDAGIMKFACHADHLYTGYADL